MTALLLAALAGALGGTAAVVVLHRRCRPVLPVERSELLALARQMLADRIASAPAAAPMSKKEAEHFLTATFDTRVSEIVRLCFAEIRNRAYAEELNLQARRIRRETERFDRLGNVL